MSDWRTRERGWYWIKFIPHAGTSHVRPTYGDKYIAQWDGGAWMIPNDHCDASGIMRHTDTTVIVCSERLPNPNA